MFHDVAGHEKLTQGIIGCAIRVHEAFGPGLLESIYKECLIIELGGSGFRVETRRQIPLRYRGQDLHAHFSPDIVVQDTVIVELKAVEALAPVHTAQLITYLKLSNLPIGLLINFNVELLVKGVRRVVRPDLRVPKKESPGE